MTTLPAERKYARRSNTKQQTAISERYSHKMWLRGLMMRQIRELKGVKVADMISSEPSWFMTPEGVTGIEKGMYTVEPAVRWYADHIKVHPALLMLSREGGHIPRLDRLFCRIAKVFEEGPVKEEDHQFEIIENAITEIEKLRKARMQPKKKLPKKEAKALLDMLAKYEEDGRQLRNLILEQAE